MLKKEESMKGSNDELVLFIKLAERGTHVSIGSLSDAGGIRLPLNLLRLGAASVIMYGDAEEKLQEVLPGILKGYTNPDEKIDFIFEVINETGEQTKITMKLRK